MTAVVPRTQFVHLVDDTFGGWHGITVDPIQCPPGSTVSIRVAARDETGRRVALLIITTPAAREGGDR